MTPWQLWLVIAGAAVLITAVIGAFAACAGGWEAREQRDDAKRRHPSAQSLPAGIVITCDCGTELGPFETWSMALLDLEHHEAERHAERRFVS